MISIIPVKGHSTRFPGKHTLPFAGRSLLQIKIQQLRPHVDVVYVATDSESLADVAISTGAEVLWRDPKFSRDCISTDGLVAYLLNLVPLSDEVDEVVYTIATCPLLFRYGEFIHAFRTALNDGHDVLFTARLYQRHLWCNGGINWANHMPRTQDLPRWWEVTHGAFAFRARSYSAAIGVLGQNPQPFCISDVEALEIDYEEQFRVAERLFEHRVGA